MAADKHTQRERQMNLSVNGTELYYSITGQGTPLLFLHGGLEAASTGYTRLLGALEPSFTVIAVDRRGHGRSADTAEPFDYAAMAEETHAFIAGLGLGKVHILGFSDGANIGFHLAGKHPESVNRLVAVSGNYRGLSGMSAKWLEMLPKLSLEYARQHMPQVLEQYLALNPAPDPEAFITKTRSLWLQDIVVPEDTLARLPVKTLLICGDRDIMLPEQAIAMHALIPDASLLMLPDCGHMLLQDFIYGTRAEVAVRLFMEFLEKPDRPRQTP